MSKNILAKILFLTLVVLSSSFQINYADIQAQMSFEDQVNSQIHNQKKRCEVKTIEDAYGRYTADLQTMTCAKMALSNKPHCPVGYSLSNRKCIKETL